MKLKVLKLLMDNKLNPDDQRYVIENILWNLNTARNLVVDRAGKDFIDTIKGKFE